MSRIEGRLSDEHRLDTPALMAQGFRETIEELQEAGKMVQPLAVAFGKAAADMVDGIVASPVATSNPEDTMQVLKRITAAAVIAAGFGESALGFKPDTSILN